MIRILVVEDDERLNKIVCAHLKDSGYEAAGCLSAQRAYDEMYRQIYDRIISDIMMSEIDGFEFAESVRQVNHDIPILFMTARDDFQSKQKGFRTGIDDYMVKPIDLQDLPPQRDLCRDSGIFLFADQYTDVFSRRCHKISRLCGVCGGDRKSCQAVQQYKWTVL